MLNIEGSAVLPNGNSVAQKINIHDIVSTYGKRLNGFIRKRVQNQEDSDDILQDVYYQLVETDHLMKPIDQVAGWLFTVARNKITDWYRKKKPLSISGMAAQIEDESLEEVRDILFSNDDTPETEYARSLLWAELEKALEELPPEQRLVFEMHELMDISFKEISEQTGEPVNTLISRKRYAVLHLRERLRELYDEIINF